MEADVADMACLQLESQIRHGSDRPCVFYIKTATMHLELPEDLGYELNYTPSQVVGTDLHNNVLC